MQGGVDLAEFAPLVSRRSVGQSRFSMRTAAVVGVFVVCACVAGRSLVGHPSPTTLLDPRMGGVDGLGVMGAQSRMSAPADAQQLAHVDPMGDVSEMAHGRIGYVPSQARRGSIWSGLDDSVGRLPGVNVDAWGAMKYRDGVETPRHVRYHMGHQLRHVVQAGGVLSRIRSERRPDVLERTSDEANAGGELAHLAEAQAEERAVAANDDRIEGVLGRAQPVGEGDGLLGRVAVVQEQPDYEVGEEGGVLMQEGADPKTAGGALSQTRPDDVATDGVLSPKFANDAENTGGSLFMRNMGGDRGWMAPVHDDGWSSKVEDNSWKLDTSKSSGGALSQVKGDDMAGGALSTLSARMVHKLKGGEDVKGSLLVSPTEHAKELVDGSLAASGSAFGHAGSLARVKPISEQGAAAAASAASAASAAAVHKLTGGEDVTGSLSVSPTEHAKELVDGSLAASHSAYGHAGSLSRVKSIAAEEGKSKGEAHADKQATGVVHAAEEARQVVHKLHEAAQEARELASEQGAKLAKVKGMATAAKAAAAKVEGAAAEEQSGEGTSKKATAQVKDLQHLVKKTMAEMRKGGARAHAHGAAKDKAASHAAKAARHASVAAAAASADAVKKGVVHTQAKAEVKKDGQLALFGHEHKVNSLNQTDSAGLDDNWDDVGWLKTRWTLTTWVLFVAALLFSAGVTAVVGHSAGFVAAIVTLIIMVCMDIACYYYSWFLF